MSGRSFPLVARLNLLSISVADFLYVAVNNVPQNVSHFFSMHLDEFNFITFIPRLRQCSNYRVPYHSSRSWNEPAYSIRVAILSGVSRAGPPKTVPRCTQSSDIGHRCSSFLRAATKWVACHLYTILSIDVGSSMTF